MTSEDFSQRRLAFYKSAVLIISGIHIKDLNILCGHQCENEKKKNKNAIITIFLKMLLVTILSIS